MVCDTLSPSALLRAVVISKLDYCKSVLACASEVLHRLQSVLNAAARLVYSARKYEHTSARTECWQLLTGEDTRTVGRTRCSLHIMLCAVYAGHTRHL